MTPDNETPLKIILRKKIFYREELLSIDKAHETCPQEKNLNEKNETIRNHVKVNSIFHPKIFLKFINFICTSWPMPSLSQNLWG